MVKLKRLKINKYRNVRPGTELRFDDGFNLVLGQNGSGKSTLLGLISFVAGNDLSPLRDVPFAIEYDLASEQSTLRVSVSCEASEPSLEPTNTAIQLQYSFTADLLDAAQALLVRVTGTPSHTIFSLADGAMMEQPAKPPTDIVFLVKAWLTAVDSDKRLLTSLDRILQLHSGTIPRFDESLGGFHAMTGRSSPTPGVAAPNPTRIVVRRHHGGVFAITQRDYAPLLLGSALHRSPEGLSVATADTSADPAIEFLARTAELLGAISATCRPAAMSSSATAREIRGLQFTFTRTNDVTLDQDFLSYGQKRLLSFFYYLAATDEFVVADELVNGLHHRWIDACMQAIGTRQAFLTSQNPLLFDYIPEFESVEQVQSRFITCKTEVVDGAEELVWQNMSADDAATFFRGYEAEIEGVGDVLINRGLW